jgi:hypothetical protein
LDESEYPYRLPRWFIAAFAVLGFGTPFFSFVAIAVVERSWLIGVGGCMSTLFAACLAVFFWSRIRIVMDSEHIRWPLKRKELRWEDIQSSAVVRILGLRYVRIVMKNNSVTWIALNEPGGAEFRRQLLERLGLQ